MILCALHLCKFLKGAATVTTLIGNLLIDFGIMQHVSFWKQVQFYHLLTFSTQRCFLLLEKLDGIFMPQEYHVARILLMCSMLLILFLGEGDYMLWRSKNRSINSRYQKQENDRRGQQYNGGKRQERCEDGLTTTKSGLMSRY